MRNPTYNSEYPARYSHARHCVPCCYIIIHFPELKEVTKPSSLAGLAAITYIPKKSSSCHGKSEIPYCPAELAN